MAKKYIDGQEFNTWFAEFNKALLTIDGRDEAVAEVTEKIEKDLALIGCTAIEDRLQDEVDKTIQFAKDAGIKVWVLTGDKIGTAINIGMSAGLLDSDEVMNKHIIKESIDYS